MFEKYMRFWYNTNRFIKKEEKDMGKAKAGNRSYVDLVCTECKRANYTVSKNKKNTPEKLEVNKFCEFCNKHTIHREKK